MLWDENNRFQVKLAAVECAVCCICFYKTILQLHSLKLLPPVSSADTKQLTERKGSECGRGHGSTRFAGVAFRSPVCQSVLAVTDLPR